jgi:iron(III) transport system ATP-binding protein
VEGLSLQLDRGAIGCLLGASGCGKTTVLRALAGFIKPGGGSIHLAGRRLADASTSLAPESRHIGMVFQDFALFPHLSVAGNIAFGLGAMTATRRRERVSQMLALTNLQAEEKRYPHELSGGQQQRVALARALAPQPALLLLDEPFSSLDVELRERLSLEVRAILKATETTAILVTHDQREAFAVSDMVGVMSDGRIEQWDTGYNLYHRPATRYVADFVGEGVFLPGHRIDSENREHSHVQTELGFITPPDICTHRHLGAQPVDVLLRPDDVVHDDDAPLKATVIRKAFRGAEFLYTLRLPSAARCSPWCRAITIMRSATPSASGSRPSTSSRSSFSRRRRERGADGARLIQGVVTPGVPHRSFATLTPSRALGFYLYPTLSSSF